MTSPKGRISNHQAERFAILGSSCRNFPDSRPPEKWHESKNKDSLVAKREVVDEQRIEKKLAMTSKSAGGETKNIEI